MVRRGKDHLRNHLPLLRHRKALISQITTKEMYEAHDPSSPTPAHPHPERPGGDNTIMIIDNHTPAGAQVVPGEWDSGWSSFHRSRSPPIVIRWGGRLASSSSNLLITPATTLSILSAGALPCSSISLLVIVVLVPLLVSSYRRVQLAVSIVLRLWSSGAKVVMTMTILSNSPFLCGGKIQILSIAPGSTLSSIPSRAVRSSISSPSLAFLSFSLTLLIPWPARRSS